MTYKANKGVQDRVLRRSVWLRDEGRCRYCGRVIGMDELSVDHVVPFTLGGQTWLGNLVASCRPCNHAKGAMSYADFVALLKRFFVCQTCSALVPKGEACRCEGDELIALQSR